LPADGIPRLGARCAPFGAVRGPGPDLLRLQACPRPCVGRRPFHRRAGEKPALPRRRGASRDPPRAEPDLQLQREHFRWPWPSLYAPQKASFRAA